MSIIIPVYKAENTEKTLDSINNQKIESKKKLKFFDNDDEKIIKHSSKMNKNMSLKFLKLMA